MSEQRALYERILNDPISHPDAKKAAKELLEKEKQDPQIDPSADRAADTKYLARFAAVVTTFKKFDRLEIEISMEMAEAILNLAQRGYLNRYARKQS